jgi:hypothetical protein
MQAQHQDNLRWLWKGESDLKIDLDVHGDH